MTESLPMPCEPKTIPASADTTPPTAIASPAHRPVLPGSHRHRAGGGFLAVPACRVPDRRKADSMPAVGLLSLASWRIDSLTPPRLASHASIAARWSFSRGLCRLGLRFLIVADRSTQRTRRRLISARRNRQWSAGISPTGPCSLSARFASAWACDRQRQRRQCRRCHHRDRCLDEARNLFHRRPNGRARHQSDRVPVPPSRPAVADPASRCPQNRPLARSSSSG
jgi:hypothetical protein